MALTAAIKTELYQFFAIAFDAAPGTTYMDQLTQAVDAGMTVPQIVEVFTSKLQFTSVYPESASSADFATLLINNVVGASASDAAKAEAVADVEGALAAGWTRGQVIYQIFSNLAAKPEDDATWGGTSKMMANQVAVAQYATEVKQLSTANLSELRAIIADVTADTDVSTPAAIQTVYEAATRPAGQTFTLTNNAIVDVVSGTAGNDTVTGAAGTYAVGDVISDSSTTDADAFNVISNAGLATAGVVNNIETINATGQYAAVGFNLGSTVNTKVLNLAAGISGATATVTNAGATAAAKIVGGTNVTTLAVTTKANGTAGTVTVDSGAATSVTLNGVANNDTYVLNAAASSTIVYAGTTGGTDALTLNLVGGTNALTVAASDLNVLTLNSNTAANTVNLQNNNALVGVTTGEKVVVGGDKALTIRGDLDAIGGAGAANGVVVEKAAGAGLLTFVASTAGVTAGNFNRAAFDVIDIAAATGNVAQTVLSGVTTLKLSVDNDNNVEYDVDNLTGDMTANTGTLKLDIAESQAGDDVIIGAGVATLEMNVNTKNITLAGLDTSSVANTADTTVISGEKNLTISNWKLDDGDSLVATSFKGALTVTTTTTTDGNIIAGQGNDSITLGAIANGETFIVSGGAGNDMITAAAITGTAVTRLLGEDGNDNVTGGAAADILDGGAGADTLAGGTGADTILGGEGNDTITGGNGNDSLTGGAGSDTFSFSATTGNGADTITDFTVNADRLDVSATVGATTVVTSLAKAAAGGAVALDAVYLLSTDGTAASLTNGGTAVLATADFTAATLTNLAAFIAERFTANSSTTDADVATFVINHTAAGETKTYVYQWDNDTTANVVQAAELTLIGTVTRDAALTSSDIYVS